MFDLAFYFRPPAPEAASRKPASVPAGRRIYVVGDVHGRRDLLDALAGKVAADVRGGRFADAITIFLGDYVDRGPDSAGVIERLAAGDFPTPVIALRGNHEAALLDFLDDERVLDSWRYFGGLETLASYGVDVEPAMRGLGFDAARVSFARNLPARHLAFFRQTKLSWTIGDYFFCHAGVRPGVPLARQNERDLLWIRDEFNDCRAPYEKIVVHGHTPSSEPEVLSNRIGIDTGAYVTGVLTCLVLEGEERRFLSTRPDGTGP